MAKDKLISPSFCYILAANFLLFFAFYLILPILPFYLQDQFDADKSMIGFILSCYTIAALCIRPFSGYLLDTFARRPLYLLAYSVFMVIFAGYMIASLLSIFIVLRILHGFAFGMVTVSGNTIVIDILPSSRRGEGIGYYGLANNTAMSFGPMTGLFMHTSFSYETIFACSLLSCLLGFIMAYLVKTPRKQPIKKEPISLDRFFLVKGTWAGISLLLLSIPYGMTTTYVAMYADEIGISVNSGLYFTFMAIGLAVSRMFSGRQVDKGRITLVISLGMYLAAASFFRAGSSGKADAVEFGFHFLSVYRDRPFTRSRIRYDVPGFQHTVREPRSQQPEGDSDFHLSHQLGCGDRDRADDRRKHRTGFRGIQLRLPVRGVPDNFFDTVLFIESRSSFQPEQIEIRWLA